jgi:DNA polymerase-1
MRLLAHFSKDVHLIRAIESGEDVHLATAKIIFNKEDISSEERRFAKTQNFATAYGQGITAMAGQLGCTNKEAKEFRFKYFDTFPSIKKYIDKVGKRLERNGYVTTILGRKRRIPEVYSSEDGIVARAKRQGVNSIIQGSASDVLKAAMVNTSDEFKKKKLDAHILLQIHDELVIECRQDQAEEAALIVKNHMENPFNTELRVPLEVEPKICDKWSEGK